MYINTYKNQSIKNLMLSLVESKRKVTDNQVGLNIDDVLLIITKHPGSSIYKCYEHLNQEYKQNKNRTIGYENVGTRIRLLENLALIKKVKAVENGDSKTDNEEVICYSVSTAGFFYIFTKNLVNTDKDIILKNRNDRLFEIFLYPYIEIDTLEKLKSKDILLAIYEYLVNCAKIVDSVIGDHLLKIDKDNGDSKMVGFPNSLIIPEDDEDMYSYGPKFSIAYLRNRYNIAWLNQNNIKILY